MFIFFLIFFEIDIFATVLEDMQKADNSRYFLQEFIYNYTYEIIALLILFTVGGIVMAVVYRSQVRYSKRQATQLQTILSTATDGIHIHDLEGRLLMFSDSFVNNLGYTREETAKLTVFDWDHHMDPQVIKEKMKVFPTEPVLFETKHTRKDGKEIDVELIAKRITLDNQSYIYSSARDITDRKLNEVKLLKHKTIFENIAEGVYAVGRDNICTYINAAALKMLQLQEEDILGKNPHDIFYHIFEGENCPVQEAVVTAISTTVEEEFIRQDGTTFPVFVTVFPIIHSSMSIGAVITFIDSTKQKLDQNRLQTEKERFDYLAHHDTLTNLPNRLSLTENLEDKFFQLSNFAFMFMDLDGFKEINDSYGHRFGDKLLIRVSELLQQVFPVGTYIVRSGGDEFVVVIACQDKDELVNYYISKILDILTHPLEIEDTEVYVTMSVGVAMYPDDATTTNQLMQNADAAMYKAKKLGKNTYSFYDETLTQKALEKTTITTNLRKAIMNNELQMYFQAQVNPYNGKIIGAETLIRWFREEGALSPGVFIPIAEGMGVILEVGSFVLKESFLAAKQLHDKNLLAGRISVNVSVKQFTHPDFLSVVEEILLESGCSASFIELEITESSILEHPDTMIVLLNKLKAMGFRISIDDFGTGYSSMSYLKHLPIDKLKIDQSFIRNITKEPKNQTIVKTVIALAKGLDMQVIAEGVETQEELAFLMQKEIDYIQGYYYYKPISFEDFKALL